MEPPYGGETLRKDAVRKRPFIAARIEKQINRRVGATLRRLGWRDTVIAYTGYGSESRLRVLGRVVLTRRGHLGPTNAREEVWAGRRGWRNFLSLPAVNRAILVNVGGHTTNALTDRDGFIDITVSLHGLAPGWHHIDIATIDSEPAKAPILIIGNDVRFGIVSDIDDTIITSYLPRLLIAAYNTF
ncbi:MAG: ABC transporter ATP-binding protein, partial [Propionibacteriaceae bacterium]|nr:ABC transporter ATP-binding protein [Propionibacteriaceae bacterium]